MNSLNSEAGLLYLWQIITHTLYAPQLVLYLFTCGNLKRDCGFFGRDVVQKCMCKRETKTQTKSKKTLNTVLYEN